MSGRITEVTLDNLSVDKLLPDSRVRVKFPAESHLDLEMVGDLSEGAEVVPVVLSGAVADRPNKTGPFFSGRNVLSLLGVPGIMIADPSLDLDNELNLGWYAGNAAQPRLADQIAGVLSKIARIFRIDFLLIGGSGGGFASLVVGDLLGDRASVFVWNPQTDILRYNQDAVERYFSTAFGHKGDLKEIDRRVQNGGTVTTIVDRQIRARRVLYVQNVEDWHTQAHAKPFVQANNLQWRGRGRYADGHQTELWLAEWGEGHAAPPVDNIVKTVRHLLVPNSHVSSAFLCGFWQFPLPRHDQFSEFGSVGRSNSGDIITKVKSSNDEVLKVHNQPLSEVHIRRLVDARNPSGQQAGILGDVRIPADQSDRSYLLLSLSFPDGTEQRAFLRGNQLMYGGA